MSRRRRPAGRATVGGGRPGPAHVVAFGSTGGGWLSHWHGTRTAPRGKRRARRRAFLSHGPSLVCRAAGLPKLLSRGPPRPRTTPTRPPRSRCRPGRRRPAGRPPSPRFRRLHENPYAHTAHRASPDGDLHSDGRCLPPGGGRCARPGRVRLGAGSQTRANLVLARIAVRRPLGVSCGVPETRPMGETVRSASGRSKPPQPKE